MDNDAPQTHSPAGPRTARKRQADYHAYHNPDSPARYSTTLVHALADVMGRDVTDVDAVLARSIDPIALDLLFPAADRQHAPGHVAFAVEGYRVTAYNGGQIVITPPS